MLEEINKLSKEHNETFPVLAVIVFNTSHAHLIEALRKQSYVDALDEITGSEIGVFWAARPEGRVKLPTVPRGSIEMMLPVYEEPASNKTLYKFFDIEDGQSLPLLVTFSFDSNDGLYFRKTKLSENSTEDAYNQLKKILADKASLLRDLSEELKEDKRKMLKELELFDSANEAAGLLGSLIRVVGQLRSATSI
ncbi:hypothetical protein NPJ88_009525 [Halomonas elongata]|uniref:hypothetical protein n=1 Tax=Halomonas elongata TaxID=2746 RepID=UPI00255ACAAE|nr:hypothetical protein [Halomonas elongata]MDL4862572.1 hypothetical protein [Halomonas elongata]